MTNDHTHPPYHSRDWWTWEAALKSGVRFAGRIISDCHYLEQFEQIKEALPMLWAEMEARGMELERRDADERRVYLAWVERERGAREEQAANLERRQAALRGDKRILADMGNPV